MSIDLEPRELDPNDPEDRRFFFHRYEYMSSNEEFDEHEAELPFEVVMEFPNQHHTEYESWAYANLKDEDFDHSVLIDGHKHSYQVFWFKDKTVAVEFKLRWTGV